MVSTVSRIGNKILCSCDKKVASKCFTFFVAVTPNEKDIKIEGMPDTVNEGDEVNLKCSVDRVKPRPSELYWKMSFGVKELGNTTISVNEDGTFKYENVITKVYVFVSILQNLVSISNTILNLFFVALCFFTFVFFMEC